MKKSVDIDSLRGYRSSLRARCSSNSFQVRSAFTIVDLSHFVTFSWAKRLKDWDHSLISCLDIGDVDGLITPIALNALVSMSTLWMICSDASFPGANLATGLLTGAT